MKVINDDKVGYLGEWKGERLKVVSRMLPYKGYIYCFTTTDNKIASLTKIKDPGFDNNASEIKKIESVKIEVRCGYLIDDLTRGGVNFSIAEDFVYIAEDGHDIIKIHVDNVKSDHPDTPEEVKCVVRWVAKWVVLCDGFVYYGTIHNEIKRISFDGKVETDFKGNTTEITPTVFKNSNNAIWIYYKGVETYGLYAASDAGDLIRYKDQQIKSTPFVTQFGVVYQGTNDYIFITQLATERNPWVRQLGEHKTQTTPIVVAEYLKGKEELWVIYLGLDGYLYKVNYYNAKDFYRISNVSFNRIPAYHEYYFNPPPFVGSKLFYMPDKDGYARIGDWTGKE
ncbi:hypothetical protein B4U84_28800 [Westiellopsis prolifica IICB1]|nr:hypothetical protein B4U84_28800 [Westiellopsis prolifica IICB1]